MRQITDIREIQSRLNKLLNHFANVCEKNNLNFYLSNGTLLGAVKYQGFIPWDDDIDIIMPRNDYDRLMDLIDIDTDRYRLLSKERTSSWKLPFAKLSDTSTLLYETTANFGCELGIFIDIFPIDKWNSSEKKAKREAKKTGILRRFISASTEKNFYSPRKDWRRPILYLIWVYSHLWGTEHFLKRVLKRSDQYRDRDTDYVGCVVWTAYGAKEVLSKKLFDHECSIVFEGRSYKTFSGYDTYLRQLYGNYQKDPPIDKQKTHHTFCIYEKDPSSN